MKLRLAFLTIMSSLFLTGCDFIQDALDGMTEEMISPSTTNVVFPSEGGAQIVVVESECPWVLECDASWCDISPEKGGKGTTDLNIRVFDNSSSSPRRATIYLSNDLFGASVEIYVEQEGAEAVIGEIQNEFTVGSDGGDFQLEFNTNVGYYAKSDQDWVLASSDYYGEFLDVRIHRLPEDFAEPQRTATISLYRGQEYEYDYNATPFHTISVTQKNQSFRVEFTSASNYPPFHADHYDANIIAVYCNDGVGYVDFDGPITISDGLFYYDQNLVSIKLPNCVTYIGEDAFADCDALETVELPETLVSIGNGAFRSCDNLTTVINPSKDLKYIEDYAFTNCKSLSNIDLNEGLLSIGKDAFASCKSLTKVHVPNTVTNVGERAYLGCNNLQAFYGDHVTDDGCCLVIDGEIKAYAPAGHGNHYTIPAGVKSVGSYAFAYLNDFMFVRMGDDVEEIKDHAFYYSALDNDRGGVTLNNVKEIGDYAFAETNLTCVDIPDCTTRVGKYAFYGCTFLTDVDFGAAITEIEEGTFSFSAIPSFRIPYSITKIGDYAFKDCFRLYQVWIHKYVNYIGTEAFYSEQLNVANVYGFEPSEAYLGENVFAPTTEVLVPMEYEHIYRLPMNPWAQYDPHDWIPDDVENWEPA